MPTRPLQSAESLARCHIFVAAAVQERDDQFRALLRATANGLELDYPGDTTIAAVVAAHRQFARDFVELR